MDILVLDNKQALEKLYDVNTTYEIGEMVGTNQERVRLALHKHKIPVRKKGARTERDKTERAIFRLRNILREYPIAIRPQIVDGLSGAGEPNVIPGL